jgi:hypothetical protein
MEPNFKEKIKKNRMNGTKNLTEQKKRTIFFVEKAESRYD